MKFGNLKSLGHNIADSMASGVTQCEMDVFGEAAASQEGHITVDMMAGTTTGARPSSSLLHAISLYREILPRMCRQHGFDLAEVKTLVVRFGTDAVYGRHFKVTVESAQGKKSTDQYVGMPGKKLKRRR